MGLLEGKNALIFGVANERSIAWGITQALHREGARIGISYAGEALERRVKPLAEKIGCSWVEECDVSKDEHIAAVAEKAAQVFGQIDVLVHSIAFAGRDELTGPFYNTIREGFKPARLFIRGLSARLSAHLAPRCFADVYDLLRLGQGCTTLQRDGCGQGGPRSSYPLPRL